MLRRLFFDPRFSRWTAWLVPLLILAAWQGLSRLGVIPSRILPAPTDVLDSAWKMLRSGELLENILVSAQRAGWGFLAGGLAGFLLGLLNGASRVAEVFLDTTIQMIRTLPLLAMIPLVILWFGIGEPAKVFLVALSVFFPIYLNTFHGIRAIDPGLVEMARVYGLGVRGLFWNVILPGALPTILLGVRYALGIMWLTLIVAETISATAGIGHMAMNAREFMQTDVIVLSILLYALLGKVADEFVKALERFLLPWHHTQREAARTA